LSPSELDDYTPREFENKLSGFESIEQRRDQQEWEKFRLLASTLLAPHTKGGKGVKPTKLWPFEWDKVNNPKPVKMSKERLEYISNRSKLLSDGEKC